MCHSFDSTTYPELAGLCMALARSVPLHSDLAAANEETSIMIIIDQTGIERAASILLQRFGKDSARQAAIRAREFEIRGDGEGAELWRYIEFELLVPCPDRQGFH
jgi:hypothetical protein